MKWILGMIPNTRNNNYLFFLLELKDSVHLIVSQIEVKNIYVFIQVMLFGSFRDNRETSLNVPTKSCLSNSSVMSSLQWDCDEKYTKPLL